MEDELKLWKHISAQQRQVKLLLSQNVPQNINVLIYIFSSGNKLLYITACYRQWTDWGAAPTPSVK